MMAPSTIFVIFPTTAFGGWDYIIPVFTLVCGSQTSFGALSIPAIALLTARGRMFLAEPSCSIVA
jgi:hypothetical protein